MFVPSNGEMENGATLFSHRAPAIDHKIRAFFPFPARVRHPFGTWNDLLTAASFRTWPGS